MNSKDSLSPAGTTSGVPSSSVVLSPWVNERLPAWEQLLTAHDVARLTRRPRWVIASLIWVRRFPRKRRYHGRGVGWLRSDVIHWLAKDLRAANSPVEQAQASPILIARQTPLPLQCTRPCAARRTRRRRTSARPTDFLPPANAGVGAMRAARLAGLVARQRPKALRRSLLVAQFARQATRLLSLDAT
jgi:predicted DNA-binding transcriptional regulator AlpA